MQTAGAHELGYANTALLMALMNALVDKGVLEASDLRGIADDAEEALKAGANNTAVSGALSYLQKAIIPKINERSSR
jgi:hypothetical protein